MRWPRFLQSFGSGEADAGFHVGDAQLAADGGMGEGHFLADALHCGVDGEAGFDADDHQVQRVGQAVGECAIVLFDGAFQPEGWQEITDQAAGAEAHQNRENAFGLEAANVSEDETDAEADDFAPVTAFMAELE